MSFAKRLTRLGYLALVSIAACTTTIDDGGTSPRTSSGATTGTGSSTSASVTSASGGAASTSVSSTTSGPGGGAGNTGSGSGTGGAGGATGGWGGTSIGPDASTGPQDASSDIVAGDTNVRPPSDGATPSAGCGNPAGQMLGAYLVKDIMSGGAARSYRLFLPSTYDPMRAYPLAILAHGCTGNGGTPFPLEQASKNDAIVVALKSVGDCFVYGPTGADVVYFDAVLAEVSASHCVDRSRVFMAGFSSGSYLSYIVGCVRAGIVRATGHAAGALAGMPTCTGPVAAMIAHDMNDPENSFAGGERARDFILMRNGCGTDTVAYDYDDNPSTASPCVVYQGCRPGYPVVWCPTMGKGHVNQAPITTVGLWRFWSSL